MRAGERIQEFWCDGCQEWHEASVLGGVVEHAPAVFPVAHPPLKSLIEAESERSESEAA